MRVLIVKLWAMGDVIMALSMLPALKTLGADVEVTWVVGSGSKPLLELFDDVHRLITVDEKRMLRGGAVARGREILALWRQIAADSYDLVVTGHSDARYSILTLPVRGKVRRSFTQAARSGPIAGRYHGAEYARLILGKDGPTAPSFDLPEISRPLPAAPFEPDESPVVVLAPGGAKNTLRDDRLRRWPVEMYAELARLEAARGRRIVLVGGEGDRHFSPHFSALPVIDLIARTSVAQLAATLRAARVVVTHDSLALHLSRLVRTPVVAIFGPTSPLEKVPHQSIGDGPHATGSVSVLWGGADLACRPCYDGVNYFACDVNQCMRSISPRQVSESIERMLAGEKTGG